MDSLFELPGRLTEQRQPLQKVKRKINLLEIMKADEFNEEVKAYFRNPGFGILHLTKMTSMFETFYSISTRDVLQYPVYIS